MTKASRSIPGMDTAPGKEEPGHTAQFPTPTSTSQMGLRNQIKVVGRHHGLQLEGPKWQGILSGRSLGRTPIPGDSHQWEFCEECRRDWGTVYEAARTTGCFM